MYYVADVDKDICSEKACSLCTTYCQNQIASITAN